jgi:oxygen-independent coproporphyrinogen-3 oxidase
MENFGVYIHVPFCVRKCPYCDFYSIAVGDEAPPWREYLVALRRQLDLCVFAGLSGRRMIESIYFGGGTPSLMPPEFFGGVLKELALRFPFAGGAEVSFEANPATVRKDWFCEMKEIGATRASIGVQSFDDDLLGKLGRLHGAVQAMQAIAEAEDAGLCDVGIDLMYAIPGETEARLEDDIKTAMTFQPSHISAYQLTLEEGTVMKAMVDKAEMHMLSDEEAIRQMRIVERMLRRVGWKRYEISNYAKEGRECRHNVNYWRYGEYIGLGPAATSFIREPSGENFARRMIVDPDVASYLSDAARLEIEDIGKRTAMTEFSFMGLRMMDGISESRFKALFGADFDDVYGEAVQELVQGGMLARDGDRIGLTPRGIEISNSVFEKFV